MTRALSIDVSDAVGAGQALAQSVHVFLPEGPVHTVLCCLAGGSYDWHYWHLEVAGYTGYSFAEDFTARGCVVVTVDHLGTGESSRPAGGFRLTLDHLMRGDAAAVARLRELVSAGQLDPALPPMQLPIIGVGHSMGACLTAAVQASSRCYDAVVLLGYSAAVDNVLDRGAAAGQVERDVVATTAGVRALCAAADEDEVGLLHRRLVHGLFYAADVAEAVIATDAGVQTCTPIHASAEAATPGLARTFIALLDVPVFLGFGDGLDLSLAARDITLYVIPGSAHCHHLSSGRESLWDRIAEWLPRRRPH